MIRESTLERNKDLAVFFGGLASLPTGDTVILLARRSYCAYRALCESGFVDLGSRVFGENTFSSRVLDWKLDWLARRGGVVHLIDDSISRGAVFRREWATLEAAGCRVEGRVFQASQIHTEMSGVKYSRLAASQSAIRELSEAVYQLIGESGYPYLLDFPLYEESVVAPEAAAALHQVQGWTTFDITNDAHSGGMVQCLSLVPDTPGWEALEQDMPAIRSLAELVKVRVYLRSDPLGRWNVRLLPKFTLRPHTSIVAEEITEIIRGCLGDIPSILRPMVAREQGRFRLNQFLLSAALGDHFIGRLDQSVLASLNPAIDVTDLRCQLGARHDDQDSIVSTAIARCTLRHLADLPKVFQAAELPEGSLPGTLPLKKYDPSSDSPQSASTRDNDWNYSPSVAALPFVSLMMHFPPGDGPDDRLYPALAYERLQDQWTGLGLRDVSRFGPVVLDLLSDLGVAVPVVREIPSGDELVLARGYRFGENTASALDAFELRQLLAAECPGADDDLLLELAVLTAAYLGKALPELPTRTQAELLDTSSADFPPASTWPEVDPVRDATRTLLASAPATLTSNFAARETWLTHLARKRDGAGHDEVSVMWAARWLIAQRRVDEERLRLAAHRMPSWLTDLALNRGQVRVPYSTGTAQESRERHGLGHRRVLRREYMEALGVDSERFEHQRRSLAWLAIETEAGLAVSGASLSEAMAPVPGMSIVLRLLFNAGLDAAASEAWLASPAAELDGEAPISYIRRVGSDEKITNMARRASVLVGV